MEEIIGKRYLKNVSQWRYLVLWKNYPLDKSTWEPIEHLATIKDQVELFNKKLEQQDGTCENYEQPQFVLKYKQQLMEKWQRAQQSRQQPPKSQQKNSSDPSKKVTAAQQPQTNSQGQAKALAASSAHTSNAGQHVSQDNRVTSQTVPAQQQPKPQGTTPVQSGKTSGKQPNSQPAKPSESSSSIKSQPKQSTSGQQPSGQPEQQSLDGQRQNQKRAPENRQPSNPSASVSTDRAKPAQQVKEAPSSQSKPVEKSYSLTGADALDPRLQYSQVLA